MTDGSTPARAASGRLLKDDTLAKSLTATSAQPRAGHRPAEARRKYAGKLLTEKELYDRFNSLAATASIS